jgi:hypothetical protein
LFFWFLLCFLPFFLLSSCLHLSPSSLKLFTFSSIIHNTFFFVNLQCAFLWNWQHIPRCSHNPMSQKRC